MLGHAFLEITMVIPKAVVQLDEPHAGLGKVPGHQAGVTSSTR